MFSCIFVHILAYYLYVFCRENGGGGGSDGLSLRVILFLLHGLWGENRLRVLPIRLYRVRLTQCSCVDAFVIDLVIHGCVFYGWTSFRMSTRRLPGILFVSRAHYILLFIAWCAYGGRGGLMFHCARRRVNILRLFQSLLLIILLPAPP